MLSYLVSPINLKPKRILILWAWHRLKACKECGPRRNFLLKRTNEVHFSYSETKFGWCSLSVYPYFMFLLFWQFATTFPQFTGWNSWNSVSEIQALNFSVNMVGKEVELRIFWLSMCSMFTCHTDHVLSLRIPEVVSLVNILDKSWGGLPLGYAFCQRTSLEGSKITLVSWK